MAFLRHRAPVSFIIPAVEISTPKHSAFQPFNISSIPVKLEKLCPLIATSPDTPDTIAKLLDSMRSTLPKRDLDAKSLDLSVLLATATDHKKPTIAQWLIDQKMSEPAKALLHIRTEEGAKKLAKDHNLTLQDDKSSVLETALQKGHYVAVPALLTLTKLSPELIQKTFASIEKVDDKAAAVAVLNQAIREKKHPLTPASATAIQTVSDSIAPSTVIDKPADPVATLIDHAPLTLIDAVDKGETNETHALMKTSDVNAKTSKGYPALAFAVSNRRYTLISPLVLNGADPNFIKDDTDLIHVNPYQTQDQTEAVRALLNQSIFARQAHAQAVIVTAYSELRDPSALICQYDVDEIADARPPVPST